MAKIGPKEQAARAQREKLATQQEAQGDVPELTAAQISALRREMGRRGGVARAEKLSQERRSQIAKKAAKKRWSKPKPINA